MRLDIANIHLAELCKGILKFSMPRWRIPLLIGIPQDQIDGRVITWKVGFEDGVGATMATEEHSDLDTTIRDWEYIKVVCVGPKHFWEFLGELVVVYEFHT